MIATPLVLLALSNGAPLPWLAGPPSPNHEWRECYSAVVETTVLFGDPQAPDPAAKRTVCHNRRCDDELRRSSRRFLSNDGGRTWSVVWEGDTTITDSQVIERVQGREAYIRERDEQSWRQAVLAEEGGAWLDGFLWGCGGHSVWELLRDWGGEWRRDGEGYAAECDTPYGYLAVVIGAAPDHALVGYDLYKTADSLQDDLPLKRVPSANPSRSVRFTVSVTASERCEEVLVPSRGTLVIESTHDDAVVKTRTTTAHRDAITFIDALPPNEFRDGDVVVLEDDPVLRYEWEAGALVPYVGATALLEVSRLRAEYWGTDLTGEEALASGPGDPNNVYCGLYCLFFLLPEIPIDSFRDLVKPDVLSEQGGSSIQDLVDELETFDRHVRVVTGAPDVVLSALQVPAIVHVKSRPADAEPDHFILLLDHGQDSARVFWPPSIQAPTGRLLSVPYGELAVMWGGTAVVVASDGAGGSMTEYASASLPWLLITLGSAAAAMLVCRRTKGVLGQSGLLIGAALVSSGAFHVCGTMGFLSNDTGVQAVVKSSRRHFIGTTSVNELIQQSNTLVVDARIRTAYAVDRIRGAINLPKSLSWDERSRLLRGVSRERPVVVYCEPRGCPLAEAVASALIDDGFQTVTVLEGDWRDSVLYDGERLVQ